MKPRLIDARPRPHLRTSTSYTTSSVLAKCWLLIIIGPVFSPCTRQLLVHDTLHLKFKPLNGPPHCSPLIHTSIELIISLASEIPAVVLLEARHTEPRPCLLNSRTVYNPAWHT